MQMRFHLTLAALALAGALAPAAAQQAATRSYLVQLDEAPVAGYTGTVRGLAATKPLPGRKIDMRSAPARAYVSYLNQRQTAVLSTVGTVRVTHQYRAVFPGFAARLTDAQAAQLAATRGVRAVTPDAIVHADTSRTPAFLGLSAPGGLWSQGYTGENVIIGIIDSGISPENPAFSDKVDANGKPVPAQASGTLAYTPIATTRPTWAGTCQTGPGFAAADCNHKLIGARYFNAGLLAGGSTLTAGEYTSPRDGDGHGSHTASTAGGNSGVDATVNGSAVGTLSGMAPRARIAAYKTLWHTVENTNNTASGASSDLVDAIDTAVADGVDVINYSISGSRFSVVDPVEVAFLFAADAGVFVAASAGNSGPGTAVAHNSPWITTVAASTHDRFMAATATLAGVPYTGPSLQTAGLGSAASPKPLILAADASQMPFASLTAAEQAAVRLCFSDADRADPNLLGVTTPNATLDPAKVAGKIVVCDRGSNARVFKSLAVRDAGGAGMVLLNTGAAQTLNDDAHYVPTVHLASSARTAVRTAAATTTATGWFGPGSQVAGVVAPVMAGFSSRGPNQADNWVLKPDVTAPGVSVLAATTFLPGDAATHAAIAGGGYPPSTFDFYDGTSMSSPHVAGVAALFKQAKPGWSPAAIKSALMTTATGVKLASGAADTARFGYGAGHIAPNTAAGVDLVYDAGTPDYFAYLCGKGLIAANSGTCGFFGFIEPWNLNLPSITAPVVGVRSLVRTLTNTTPAAVTYSASVTMPGFAVTVSPATLTIPAGGSASYTVQALRTNATLNTFAFGQIDWGNGSKTVSSPLSLMPLAVAAPSMVSDSRIRASKAFTIGTGYNGALSTNTLGLIPATRSQHTVAQGEFYCGVVVNVPANAQFLRVALYDSETSGQGQDDLDLYVYNAAGTQVAGEADADSTETGMLRNPPPGDYTVCVDGFSTAGGRSTYTLSTWVGVSGRSASNVLRVVAPTTVATAGTGTVNLAWSVPAGNRHFGVVRYVDGAGALTALTDVMIDGTVPAGTAVAVSGGGTQKLSREKLLKVARTKPAN